jgi:hypothetical protein
VIDGRPVETTAVDRVDDRPDNADRIRVLARAREFEGWTSRRIDFECADRYQAYGEEVRAGHIEYFARRPARRSDTHLFLARTREAAFPDGWEHLAGAIGEQAWHRHHLSAGSSQVLAIALLAAATSAERSLKWLPLSPCAGRALTLFEVELAASVLHERPRQTSLDWMVLDERAVIAAEAKFTERGFGRCSCDGRAAGACSERVLERPYWKVAARDLCLGHNDPTVGCSLSLAYQVVRNIAAAEVIAAEGRAATFLLLYDARNPYFTGAGEWPGWVMMLSELMPYSTTAFTSLSWQELLARVEVDEGVRRWAADKHGLWAAVA